jgi:truncated hemoglobin YjbI
MSEVGNLTALLRKEYIIERQIVPTPTVLSLTPSANDDDPVYFWQLYEAMGERRIRGLISRFYCLVFSDDEAPWFRDAFKELGDLEDHVNGQSRFWLDATGGGKHYKSMQYLRIKHRLAAEVMTKAGATRWVQHFAEALMHADLGPYSDRVSDCIVDFINFFMERYAIEFDFNFIELRLVSRL